MTTDQTNQIDQKANTFAQMESEQTKKTQAGIVTETKSESLYQAGEVAIDAFSDTAVGENIKYNRPALDGFEDVVEQLQVFMPDIEQEPETARNGKTRYWKVSMKISYASKNTEGLNNREFISGAKMFKQDNGEPSKEISFWYPGTETQCGHLWELCAKAKGKNPDEISPREFVAFWNSRPKVKLASKPYKNYGSSDPSAPKYINKNIPGEILS